MFEILRLDATLLNKISPQLNRDTQSFAPQAEIPATEMGCLEIDLNLIQKNYEVMRSLAPYSEISAVLKADGYGFGAAPVGQTLKDKGCKTFFVAHLDEAIALRQTLKTVKIYVLTGVLPGTEDALYDHNLTPVLNHKGMLELWSKKAIARQEKLPVAIHVDTGMHRLGFEVKEIVNLADQPDVFNNFEVELLMSHLACSQISGHEMNEIQLQAFQKILPLFPNAKKSLSDAGGLFLDSDYHFDIIRPGLGFFGMHPRSLQGPNPFHNVLTLWGKVIQVRDVDQGETVGYGATHQLKKRSRLATLGIGFADGLPRALSNSGHVYIAGYKAPILGRISMDYTVVDVTDVPEALCYPGSWVQLVNNEQTLDDLAKSINTISRELSIHLGSRLWRVYRSI